MAVRSLKAKLTRGLTGSVDDFGEGEKHVEVRRDSPTAGKAGARRNSAGSGKGDTRRGSALRTTTPDKEKNKQAQDKEKLVEDFKAWLTKSEGSVLRAWRRCFDVEGMGRIKEPLFLHVLKTLNCPGPLFRVFSVLDDDGSGELSLDEIDREAADTWLSWCNWAESQFTGSTQMVQSLHWSGGSSINFEHFKVGVDRLGWTSGHEKMLFEAMNLAGRVELSPADMKWLDKEKRKVKLKEDAKKRALKDRKKLMFDPKVVKKELHTFKKYLKRTYGTLVRAWRAAISPNDSVNVSRTQFLQSCAKMGFQAKSKLLWHSFGKSDDIPISLYSLDPASAEMFAEFQICVRRLGGCQAIFRALDRENSRRLRIDQFTIALRGLGIGLPAKELFEGLDKDQSRTLEEDDLYFLDTWKFPEFLTAKPNHSAMEAMKKKLLKQYGSYLKAWRVVLDSDNSNRCHWNEFQVACKKTNFDGDIPGAWRAMDIDCGGHISLREVDEPSAARLYEFKKWADDSFGGVRSAFGVFDSDGSGSLTLREFRHNCRIFGYNGSAAEIFRAIDVESNGDLKFDEIGFLDEWDFEELEEEHSGAEDVMQPREAGAAAKRRFTAGLLRPKVVRKPQNLQPVGRSWWHELPCKKPWPDAQGPGTGLPVAWCSLCQSRGPCRHFALPTGNQAKSGKVAKVYKALMSPDADDAIQGVVEALSRSRQASPQRPGTSSSLSQPLQRPSTSPRAAATKMMVLPQRPSTTPQTARAGVVRSPVERSLPSRPPPPYRPSPTLAKLREELGRDLLEPRVVESTAPWSHRVLRTPGSEDKRSSGAGMVLSFEEMADSKAWSRPGTGASDIKSSWSPSKMARSAVERLDLDYFPDGLTSDIAGLLATNSG